MNKALKNIIAASVFIFSLSSCNTSTNDSHADEKGFSTKEWTAKELVGMYSFKNDNDTIILNLKDSNDSLIGDLSYSFEGKDHNKGIFRGVVKDSIIIGKYSFMSEGINSVRETVFGIIPEGLIEGFGDIEEKDSVIVFKNIDSLRFDHGMILKK